MIKHHMIYNGFPVALLIKIFHQEKPKQDMSVFWDVDGLVSSPNGVYLKIMCPIQWIWNLKVTWFRAQKISWNIFHCHVKNLA